jgi:hypothetical protein
VLSAMIAVIIMVSLFQLISIVFTLLVLDAFNPWTTRYSRACSA